MKTVGEVRIIRLKQLIAEAGSVQAVADRMGRTHSQISQLKTRALHSGSGKPRELGSDLAREFEVAFAKPRGWMDNDPELVEGDAAAKARHWHQLFCVLAAHSSKKCLCMTPARFLAVVDEVALELGSQMDPAEAIALFERRWPAPA